MLFFILRNSIVMDSQQHVKLSQSSLHWYFSRQREIFVRPWEPDQSTRNGFHHFLLCKKPLSSHSTSFPFLQYSLLFFSETVKRDNHTYYLIHSDSPYKPMSFLIFIVLSFSIYCSIHNCNLIGKNFVLLRHTFISDIYFIWIYVYCSIRHLLFLSLSRYFCIHHNVNRNICKRDTIYPF